MLDLPANQHISYQLQSRKCGKPTCKKCQNGGAHGPYWYAYWRENGRMKSGYVGKNPPPEAAPEVPVVAAKHELSQQPIAVKEETHDTTSAYNELLQAHYPPMPL